MSDIDAVLEFWLEPKPTTPAENDAAWQKWFFNTSPELDLTIRERFGALLQVARRGELDSWKASARGTLALIEHLFAAMPFRHAEDLEAQRVAVDLAQRHAVLAATTQPALLYSYVESVEWARRHYDVIARFGRFPHRNATLRRDPTPEETEYLTYLKAVGKWL